MANFTLILTTLIVAAILIIWLNRTESFRSCAGTPCDGHMPRNGIAVVNPFVWPYSGTPYLDDLYILNKDTGLNLGFDSPPITHLSTPDHVELM